MTPSDRPSEIHLFLLWSNALPQADRILENIAAEFTIRDVFQVAWSREHFARNLTRFYGQVLPAGSDKEIHCGTDPFLVVVVEDEAPRYARRKTSHGKLIVNARMFDAKKRYRRWTGGGHRVHATLDTPEADKDLFLLLGRRASFYETAAAGGWEGTISVRQHDLLGATGWTDRGELLNALEASVGGVLLSEEDPIMLLVRNRWWAAHISNGSGKDDADLNVRIAGRESRMMLCEVGDGSFDSVWQRHLMAHAVRNSDGVLVPGTVDRFYLKLRDVASDHVQLTPASLQFLDEVARRNSLPTGNYSDREVARSMVTSYVSGLQVDASTGAVSNGRRWWPWRR